VPCRREQAKLRAEYLRMEQQLQQMEARLSKPGSPSTGGSPADGASPVRGASPMAAGGGGAPGGGAAPAQAPAAAAEAERKVVDVITVDKDGSMVFQFERPLSPGRNRGAKLR
jgi:hypothetical protein